MVKRFSKAYDVLILRVCLLTLRGLPVARLPASDQYLFASGEHRVAGGDKKKVTRREASDCRHAEKIKHALV